MTIKKNITNARVKKLIAIFKNAPIKNVLPFIEKDIAEKSTWPAIPIKGVIISDTNAVIKLLNATPITTAIAKSITFPLVMNVLNSSVIEI